MFVALKRTTTTTTMATTMRMEMEMASGVTMMMMMVVVIAFKVTDLGSCVSRDNAHILHRYHISETVGKTVSSGLDKATTAMGGSASTDAVPPSAPPTAPPM